MISPIWRQPDNPQIVRHAKTPCPNCRAPLDAARSTRRGPSSVPADGDFTICAACLTPLVFQIVAGVAVTLRLLTDAEAAEEADLIEQMKAFVRARRRR